MTARDEAGRFTAAEEAYFESKGEVDPFAEAEAPAEGAESQPVADPAPAPAAAETAPEAAPEPAEPAPEPQKTVPHQALHEARQSLKEMQAEAAALREQKAAMEERFRIVMEAFQAQQQAAQQPAAHVDPIIARLGERPDHLVDLFAAQEWDRQANELRYAMLSEQVQRAEQERVAVEQERQYEAQVWDYWRSDRAKFEAAEPEFGAAARFLIEERHKELEALSGIYPQFTSMAARNEQIDRDLKALVVDAAQRGRSPAEIVFMLAKAKRYQKAVEEAAAAGGLPASPPPMSATPAPGTVVSPAAAEKIAAAAKVEAAAKSLSAVPGGTGTEPMSLEALSKLPQREFDKYVNAMDPDAKRRLMGG
jgi:hypothetical protein